MKFKKLSFLVICTLFSSLNGISQEKFYLDVNYYRGFVKQQNQIQLSVGRNYFESQVFASLVFHMNKYKGDTFYYMEERLYARDFSEVPALMIGYVRRFRLNKWAITPYFQSDASYKRKIQSVTYVPTNYPDGQFVYGEYFNITTLTMSLGFVTPLKDRLSLFQDLGASMIFAGKVQPVGLITYPSKDTYDFSLCARIGIRYSF